MAEKKVVPAWMVINAFPMKVVSVASSPLAFLGVDAESMLTLQQAYEVEQFLILAMVTVLDPDSVTGRAAAQKMEDFTLSPDSEEPGPGTVFQI